MLVAIPIWVRAVPLINAATALAMTIHQPYSNKLACFAFRTLAVRYDMSNILIIKIDDQKAYAEKTGFSLFKIFSKFVIFKNFPVNDSFRNLCNSINS